MSTGRRNARHLARAGVCRKAKGTPLVYFNNPDTAHPRVHALSCATLLIVVWAKIFCGRVFARLLRHAVGVHLHNCRLPGRPPYMETTVPNLAYTSQTSRSRADCDIFDRGGPTFSFFLTVPFRSADLIASRRDQRQLLIEVKVRTISSRTRGRGDHNTSSFEM